MWGFESLLPCQIWQGKPGGREEKAAGKSGRAMLQAAKVADETREPGQGFSVPGPLRKLAEYPKRWRQFLHEVRVEMKQVNWPTRDDVTSTTVVVVVTVGFFALYFALVDGGLGYLVQRLFKNFNH
jgi:preprotein translocase subunit SecE